MPDTIALDVYFIHEIDDSPDPVTSVFADSLGEESPGVYTVYAHVGQHSTGSPEWIRERTRPASPKEYEPLLNELARIGYVVTPVPGV
jgi:hypothetical protein